MIPVYTLVMYWIPYLIAVINSWFNTYKMLACNLNNGYCLWCKYVYASERGWLCVILIDIIITEMHAIKSFSVFKH